MAPLSAVPPQRGQLVRTLLWRPCLSRDGRCVGVTRAWRNRRIFLQALLELGELCKHRMRYPSMRDDCRFTGGFFRTLLRVVIEVDQARDREPLRRVIFALLP